MIITIARQCGCGAARIGELLSKKLGLELFTRQMLIDMAMSHGMGDAVQSFVDEHPVDDIIMAISDQFEASDEVTKNGARKRYLELQMAALAFATRPLGPLCDSSR